VRCVAVRSWYHAAMDARPWYRLHWMTWLVLAAFAGILAFHQVVGFRLWPTEYAPGYRPGRFFIVGWPVIHSRYLLTTHGLSKVNVGPGILPIAGDALCSVAAIASVAFVVQRIMSSRMQFGTSTLFSLIAVVAIVLVILPVEQQLVHQSQTLSRDGPFFKRRPLFLSVPTTCGVAATVYTTSWLAVRLARRLLGLRPPAPSTPSG